MINGTFETHLTGWDHDRAALAAFAAEHGLGYVYIELDRGFTRHQPMLTLPGSGTLEQQHAMVRDWCARLKKAGIRPTRTKIEAAPWSTGVPDTDRAASAEPDGRYFEHHVKVRLPSAAVADLLALTDLSEAHGARLSRNARRRDTDGGEERFVNQRCHKVGRATATERLDRLVAALRTAGHDVASVEQEYVVYDSNLDLDQGWLNAAPPPEPWVTKWEQRNLPAPAASRAYPATYQPLRRGWDVAQRAAFDPALKQHGNAFTAGEPVFADPELGQRWKDARRSAMRHLLTVIAGIKWANHLVLRGSSTMASWVGTAAREPGDLDFVVVPPAMTSGSADAEALLADLTAAVAATPGAGLRPERTTQSAIWTYERADGRRLVIPFTGHSIPDGIVQLDLVFGESLPIPPEPITVLGVDLPGAATAELSLAWKLLWLATDRYPQGKDLYDAVLLAEYTTVDLGLVRELMRPELRELADEFTAATVLSWRDVDWANFAAEYPGVEGTAEQWLRRLALALDRS
ncbi:nucleotidyl transferase AbiEii/AbiGii toxin family protein [Actinoplanes sp. NPDC051346]|uniref:nucleotidyl transferase AbiEii/AbiGii toxin family protein n=1 Tax=Actinoplanes sp. NPDC051346 TaxID=3155048 RepID=UPI00343FD1F7